MAILSVILRDDGEMKPEQLHGCASDGYLIEAKVGVSKFGEPVYVSLKRATHPKTGTDVFAMYGGKTGLHCLAVEATNADRLAAHWKGYIENNVRAEVRK
jgi:hypothetical protein